MTLLGMARRHAFARPFLTVLNVSAVALGALLIAVVLGLNRGARDALTREAGMFDLVVGAKGSPLQLVLSSLYHLDAPTGNIRRETAERLAADPRVAFALPLCLGDNYRSFRIVGTSTNLFHLTAPKQTEPLLLFSRGRAFAKPFEVVLGAALPAATELGLGASFSGSHGVVSLPGSASHDEFPYTVVGILAPTGTAFDRAIYTPMESVWEVHAHEERAHDAIKGIEGRKPSDEVTSLLLRLKLRAARFALAEDIRARTEAMPAVPLNELNRFFLKVLEPMRLSLLAVAWMVVLAAMLSVTATLLQSAERRRRDLAILRCLGARPRHVLTLMLLEGLVITGLGVLAGALAGHGLLHAAAEWGRTHSGMVLDAWSWDREEILALSAVLATGLVAGLIPGLLGYRRTPARDLFTG